MPADLGDLLERTAGRPGPFDLDDVRRRAVALRRRRLAAAAAAAVGGAAIAVPLALMALLAPSAPQRVEFVAPVATAPAAPSDAPVASTPTAEPSPSVGSAPSPGASPRPDSALVRQEVAALDLGGNAFTVTAVAPELAPSIAVGPRASRGPLAFEVAREGQVVATVRGVPSSSQTSRAVSTGAGVVVLGLVPSQAAEVRLELGDGQVVSATPEGLTFEFGAAIAAYAVGVPVPYVPAAITTVGADGQVLERRVLPPQRDPGGAPGNDFPGVVEERLVQVADGVLKGEPWTLMAGLTETGGPVVDLQTSTGVGFLDHTWPALAPGDLVVTKSSNRSVAVVFARTGTEVTRVRVLRGSGAGRDLAIVGLDTGLGRGFAIDFTTAPQETMTIEGYAADGRLLDSRLLQGSPAPSS